jgi:acylphosphatase
MNEDDERAVSVVAEGPRHTLDELEAFLRVGPRGAHIERIEVSREPASGGFHRFEITRP